MTRSSRRKMRHPHHKREQQREQQKGPKMSKDIEGQFRMGLSYQKMGDYVSQKW